MLAQEGVATVADDFRRDTANDGERRDILGNHCPSADDGSLSDVHPG